MKHVVWPLFIAAICLIGKQGLLCAQQSPIKQTGNIAGVVRDPMGAVVRGAKVAVKNLASGATSSRETNAEGRFSFQRLEAGRYDATVAVSGFEIAEIREIAVTAGKETVADVTLHIAPAWSQIEVEAQNGQSARRTISAGEQANSRNAAEIAAESAGVSLRESGALDGVPFLHGLGDERTKVVVNGATVESSCPNHMNAAMSYAAPAQASAVTVLAGITPVSQGGDSLGGTVVVEGPTPIFATAQERAYEQGTSTGYYRSNGEQYGGSVTDWAATEHLAIGYTGAWRTNGDYTDGAGNKVTSTYAQSTEHVVTLAAQGKNSLATVEGELDHTPYEGFVNAQMDMTRNYAERLRARYRKSLEQGSIDVQGFWQGTWHSMNIGHDKSTFPMPMIMPMNTHGRNSGYGAKLELPLGSRHTLRAGNELNYFRLDDIWPAVAGTAPWMGPNTFLNINNGTRTRLGTYAELTSRWNAAWTTLLGARNDTVWTNAGPVQGYCNEPYMGMACPYTADANAFNAQDRAHADPMIDVTAQANWVPNAASTFEFGYARKNRAPSLYERYAWSANWMASGMIGWFGDGNYYVGDVALKPETANTVTGSALLLGRGARIWEIKASPYLTAIENYIDVDTLATNTFGSMSTFAQLQFANHAARIYGGDLSASAELWDTGRAGTGTLSAVGAWLHGERTDSSTPLYHMMPLNARVSFKEEARGFTGGVGMEAVDRKRNVDPRRYEPVTPGYTLVSAQAGYRKGRFEASVVGENLANRLYELPLGGINMDNFMAGMWMGQVEPVTGRGRSVGFSLTASF